MASSERSDTNDEDTSDTPPSPCSMELLMTAGQSGEGVGASYQSRNGIISPEESPLVADTIVQDPPPVRSSLLRRRRSCKSCFCCIAVALVLSLGLLGLVVVSSSNRESWFQPLSFFSASSSSSSSSSLCSEPDRVMAMKDRATVEHSRMGAVASDHAVCSKMGVQVLQQGGNAVDSAVATALCLGVANPASSGMGGGAFLLIHMDRPTEKPDGMPDFIDARDPPSVSTSTLGSNNKVTEVIDCREVAPQGASQDMYAGLPQNASTNGGLAVAVPGELRGLELAHARHGRLTWAQVVEPAMRLARDGVAVSDHLAGDIAHHSAHLYGVSDLNYLLTKNGNGRTPLRKGDLMVQRGLSQTLEAIMEEGADALYKGKRAAAIVREVQRAGGILTTSDLKHYRAALRSPVVASDCSDFTLVGVPPPSSGGVTLIGAARFLAGYTNPLATYAEALSKHRMVEAMRHAFAIRMSLSDPDFDPSDTGVSAVDDLVKGSYMEHLRQSTRDNSTLSLSLYGGAKWAQLQDHEGSDSATDAQEGDRRMRGIPEGSNHRQLSRHFGYLNDHGTSHLSVVDKDRNAVAITTSLNTYFGSGVYSKSTGILLNDQMDDFGTPGRPNYYGLRPSESNFIEPGKKPLSSMSPTMVFRKDYDTGTNRLFMVLGASGGPKIITAVFQVFVNFALLGMPLFESIAHPRLHDQLLYHGSATTVFERSVVPAASGHHGDVTIEVSNITRAALRNRGHRLLAVDYTGTVQAVTVDPETDTLTAVSDIRKGGTPAGY